MKVRVTRLWREGIQVPRWQLAQLKAATGELRIEYCNDEHLNRHLRQARLYDFSRPQGQGYEVLPPLVDAAVLWICDSRMTISGFERNELLPTYAQTWVVEILPDQSK